MTTVPVVDMRQLRSPDLADRRRAGEQMVDGYRRFGLYHLTNHGVPPHLKRRFFEAVLAYARLPESVRQGHMLPGCWGQRGYAEGEQAVNSKLFDFKAWWFANPVNFSSPAVEKDLRRRWPELHPVNYWPTNLPPDFESVYLEYGRAIYEIYLACERGIALGLGLPEDTFINRVIDGPHQLRALIYWPLTEDMLGKETSWGAEHTDFNRNTKLPGGMWVTPDGELTESSPDSESGLWQRTPGGVLVPGQPPPGCMVGQCGQQTETTVGGELLATPHLIRPPKVAGWMRLAAAFFGHEHVDNVLAPIDGFNSPQQVEVYGPARSTGVFDLVTLHQIKLSGLSDAGLLELLRRRGVVLPQGDNDAQVIERLGYRYDLRTQPGSLTGAVAG